MNVIDFLKNDFKFYNIINSNKQVISNEWSGDAHGRTLWALGFLIDTDEIPINIRNHAERLFKKGLRGIKIITSPRAIAYTIIGLSYYNSLNNSKEIIETLSNNLIYLYQLHSNEKWDWFENSLTYSNSKLPEALLHSYRITKNKNYLKVALKTLDFLIKQTFDDGVFSPIGQDGWYFKNKKKALYDQQPVEAGSMVQTLILTYQITKEETYLRLAFRTFEWYLGRNSLHQVIYDDTFGGCYDGLEEKSVNLNLGAESTVTYLLARLSIEEVRININY